MLDEDELFILGLGIHAAEGADVGGLKHGFVGVVDVLLPEGLHLIKILYYSRSQKA